MLLFGRILTRQENYRRIAFYKGLFMNFKCVLVLLRGPR